MDNVKGIKLGWIGGWLGSFLWFLGFSIVWLVRGDIGFGLAGFLLFGIALFGIFYLAPWRFPETRYWKLITVLLILLFVCVYVTIEYFGGFEASGLKWWNIFLIMPVLSPLAVLGHRRWSDSLKKNYNLDK